MSGKYALVIANTDYNDPALAQLTAPGRDAEDFARVLRDKEIGAFDDVQVLLNQPQSTANEAIDELFAQKKPDDLLLLYFSGHGVRDEIGALYLAVKNTNHARLRSTAIKSDFIREAMDQSRSKRIVLILDCCNSGAFAQGTKAMTGGSVGTASAFEGTGYGRIILTASDCTQFAWEGDKIIGGETQNSLFTHFLVKGLEGEADHDYDGRITVDELFDYAYEQIVTRTPKQRPGKWSYKQQGEIVLRQGTRVGNTKPVFLPNELIEAIEDSRTFVREGAITQLEKLLKGKNLGLARVAREALEKMAAEDDSRRVAQIAAQALEAIHQAEQLAAQKAEEERLAREKIEAEQKADAKCKAKEEAQRLLAQKAEEERLAREKIKAEQKAKAERKAKEDAQRLAMQKAEEERLAREKVEAEQKARPREIQTKYRKHKNIIPIIIAVSIIVCVTVIGLMSFLIAPNVSSMPQSYVISDLYTSTFPYHPGTSRGAFSSNDDIYVHFDVHNISQGTEFKSKWYRDVNILGYKTYFLVGQIPYSWNSGSHVRFQLSNPGIPGFYRVDIYMNEILIGIRYFEIE